MVQISGAVVGHDSSGVELEVPGLGVDCDGDGLEVQGGDQLVGGVLGHVHKTGVFEGGGEGLASSVTGGVRIGFLSRDSVGLDPFECLVHKTSVAALVSVLAAVHQGLFGELLDFSVFDGVETFEGAHGGKGPAGSALSLVFDSGNGSFLSPIDGISLRLVSDEELGVLLLLLLVGSQVDGFELLLGEVREFIVGNVVVSSHDQVVVLDFGVVGFVVLESNFLFTRSVFHTVLGFPGYEVVVERISLHSSRLRFVTVHQEINSDN